MMEKHKFQSYTDEEERQKKKSKIFTVRLNEQELIDIKEDMKVLQQVKPSTTLKILWAVGRNVLHDEKTGKIYKVLLDNLRKNERMGIVDPNAEIEQM